MRSDLEIFETRGKGTEGRKNLAEKKGVCKRNRRESIFGFPEKRKSRLETAVMLKLQGGLGSYGEKKRGKCQTD